MTSSSGFFRILSLFLVLISKTALCAGGIDLHAHLFMKEGLGPLFNGDFHGALKAKDWNARFDSQINAESLKASGLSIVVASLYAHPWLTGGKQKESIRSQIQMAREFVKANPSWILAKTPDEARRGLSQGKQVLVLSLEGAAGVLETEKDLKEFVDEGGIRIVTFFHLTDDHLGGAALLDGLRGLASPEAFFRSFFGNHRGPLGELINLNGVSQKGISLLSQLLGHGVWIDLAHATDSAWQDVLPLLRSRGHPLLVSHTALRKRRPMERAISDTQVQDVARSGGMIGLMASEEMLRPLQAPTPCHDPFGEQFDELTKVLGVGGVTLGSDFNGGIRHLGPKSLSCNPRFFNESGFWNLGQTQGLWKFLFDNGHLTDQTSLLRMETRFIECWDRAVSQSSSIDRKAK